LIFLENKNIELHIFGSCATNLALPSSDIDIGVSGFENVPRYELL
jgi:DNA polymerase sigma